MKIKLLKIVRKRFSINYYPNIDSVNKYVITDHEKGGTLNDPFDRIRLSKSHERIEYALSAILIIVRRQYSKFSRKYKLSKIKTKVWYK